MNKDIFRPFLKNKYFRLEVPYEEAVLTRTKGRTNVVYNAAVNIKVVMFPLEDSLLNNLGLGKLITDESFVVFTKQKLTINSLVTYENLKYQVSNLSSKVKQQWNNYGYYRYIVSLYSKDTLT